MAQLEVTGNLFETFDEQQVTSSFRKREFIIEMLDGNYTQHVKFQLTQDRCGLLDQYAVGDELKVSFNLTGRRYTNPEGKVLYFTNLNAWRLERTNSGGDVPPPPDSYGAAAPAAGGAQDDPDDLPF